VELLHYSSFIIDGVHLSTVCSLISPWRIDRQSRREEKVGMRPVAVILAVGSCLICAAVQAQPIQGFYIGAGAGLRIQTPIKNTPIAPGMAGYYDLGTRLGLNTDFSVGYALGNGWRFELEGNYGTNSISGSSGTTFPATASGRIRNLGFMTNALFDMDVGSPYIYPYLGLGVGYQSTRLDSFTLTRSDKPFALSASGQAGELAWQSIVGVSLPIPNLPGLSVTVDYRFMDVLGGEKFDGTASSGASQVPGATKFHNQFSHNVLFGVRYAFNAPPPAPAQTAAASPAGADTRVYQVNLGLDIGSLSNRARAILRDAAEHSGPGRTILVRVRTGGANGTRGAETVAAALVEAGLPRDEIGIQSGPDRSASRPDSRIEIIPE
jgi:OmpA-OmpF porin, OOP family